MALNKQGDFIDGQDFKEMFLSGAVQLRKHAEDVNRLNVFPVPDGDTGTNMNLTVASGIEELQKNPTSHLGHVAKTISKGLLMGARGNSGVILSQLFRGFATSVQECEKVTTAQFASALQEGVDSAYRAVIKPVEGTILTVSKEVARHAMSLPDEVSMTEFMEEIVKEAKTALANTPNQLPILKQVGVVDAGGQGLTHIYEGFLLALKGEVNDDITDYTSKPASLQMMDQDVHTSLPLPVQLHMMTDEIGFGYCTEFMIHVSAAQHQADAYIERKLREELQALGDSLVVVADDEWIKVHIHAEYPGEVMNMAMNYGDLSRIKIENMREQHARIVDNAKQLAYDATQQQAVRSTSVATIELPKRYGFIAVVSGQGNARIFKSLGVDVVVSGGQSMNPSAEDILHAIEQIHAETVFILPNNSNVYLAAQQATGLSAKPHLYVLPTKTIPQGISAMIAFRDDVDQQINMSSMLKSLEQVKSGQVTVAVRDSLLDGINILQGAYIGIQDGAIVTSERELFDASRKLIVNMIDEHDSMITFLTGDGAALDITNKLVVFIRETFPELEIEIHDGGQPLYPYLVSVE